MCKNGSKELLPGASSTDPACRRAEVTPLGLSGVVSGLRAHRKHFAPERGKKKSLNGIQPKTVSTHSIYRRDLSQEAAAPLAAILCVCDRESVFVCVFFSC